MHEIAALIVGIMLAVGVTMSPLLAGVVLRALTLADAPAGTVLVVGITVILAMVAFGRPGAAHSGSGDSAGEIA